VIEFGDAELEYDPSTGQPAEDWSIPMLVSGGVDPVIAFAFDLTANFNGFLHATGGGPLPCTGSASGDISAAGLASFDFDISTGVYATAEFVEIQDEYRSCVIVPPGGYSDLRYFSVGVVESLQGPFSGQILETSIQVGSLIIELSNNSLLNDLNGANISTVQGSAFSPPIVPEITYLNGTAAPLTLPNGTISFVRANSFKRGTFEAGDLTISDPVRALLYLFGGGDTPSCFDSVDANDDGAVDLGDPVLVLTYLFAAGPAPLPPHSQCGSDLTPDALDCVVDICG
jgi:hypothetical protein